MTFPILYKVTKTGALQTYEVSTAGDTITVTQGQLDGKKQSYLTTCLPKNEGRSNATTGTEQAELEAASKHAKKLKSGYVLDPSGKVQVTLPMKIKVYQDQIKNVQFPCTVQPKLNGVNATATLQPDNTILITSRGGEVYPSIPHLEPHLHYFFSYCNTTKLAGELYIHGEHLQDISSAVKKPNELSKELVFCIFDLPEVPGTYIERMSSLKFERRSAEYKPVSPILGTIAESHEDIELAYNTAMAENYEGIVIYNHCALYEYNVRSSNIFKYKKTQDAEYQVTDYTIDKNKHPIYTCTTPEGLSFQVKRKGTNEERLADATIADQNIGKWLTVEYEVLSKDLIPLKPVGNNFRNCAKDGTPIE